ncbi:cilium assembly protein DZIP1 isoform X2 [Scophthalmus maximus]|uniref:cilium assembly protein DZIP1 isoform X2 n=1 Tax=Scophthalmus maximus TaxID=52904 RepID=UPI001FA91025|nr:cilium assembly protein DZIP1 isoform X2 [Scophthalmus maximus]
MIEECGEQLRRPPSTPCSPVDGRPTPTYTSNSSGRSAASPWQRGGRACSQGAGPEDEEAAPRCVSPRSRGDDRPEMPFHNGVYYPYTSDTRGTHSSAGIPSLLSSPLSQHSASAASMTPSGATAAILPFSFRPRREIVDWQRLNEVDINRVMSKLDVDALQEHISTVAFCSLDGERCQRCRNPVDPALLKLLQLAQLTVEWVLHCQECLTADLHKAEEQLEAAGAEHRQLLELQSRQQEKEKALDAELKKSKKEVRELQSQLVFSSQKCPHCAKSFLTSDFLQRHMQRRHPDEYKSQVRSDVEKTSQLESLKLEKRSLEEQNVQLLQRLQVKEAQEKEQQSAHKDLQTELDRFRVEEIARTDRKIDDTRDGMRREMEFLYSRNAQALNELNQNQIATHENSTRSVSPQAQNVQKLEQRLKKQEKKWASVLQEIKTQHESEKNQLQDLLSRQQERSQTLWQETERRLQEMERRLQDKDLTIRTQREQIRNISSNPPTKVVEVPVKLSAAAPEPKAKRVVLDSSSASERRPVERKPAPLPEKKAPVMSGTLKRKLSIKKDMRPELEQAVAKALEDLGVKSNQNGLKNKELTSILAKVQSKRDRVAKGLPDYWQQRKEISSTLDEKMGGRTKGSDSSPESQARSRQSLQALQLRPRSSSLPSGVTKVTSRPAVKLSKTPQPAPRTKNTTHPKTSTPIIKPAPRTSRTPPFSSDKESEEDDWDTEEEQPHKQQRGKSPQPRLIQATPVHIRAVQPRQPVARLSYSSNSKQPRGSASAVTKMADAKTESDGDDEEMWSEVSELQEIESAQLKNHKDQNGNVDKRNFESKVTVVARKIEQQFADRVVKIPAGGISILSGRRDVGQELKCTDLDESSGEERQEIFKPAPGSGTLRKSLDSPSTSAWGTSTGRSHKSGDLNETGTDSFLKSSLCSVSDISDSEDISDKHR